MIGLFNSRGAEIFKIFFVRRVCVCVTAHLNSNAVAGESALDRIACGLGGKIILPLIKQLIVQMLQNSKETIIHR